MTNSRAVKQKSTRTLLIGLILIALAVALMCAGYITRLRSTMREENRRYLTEVSEHVSAMVDYRVENTYQTLTAIAITCTQMHNKEMLLSYLGSMGEEYGFLRVGAAGRDGLSYTADGLITDVSGYRFVQDALAGRNGMEGPIPGLAQPDETVIAYAVPIWGDDGSVLGAVVASTTQEKMRSYMNVESFGGKGYSQIIRSDGAYVVRSEHENAPEGMDNFFAMLENGGGVQRGASLDEMREDMAQSRTGVLYYTSTDGIPRTMTYIPLKEAGWYLLSVVPTRVAEANSSLFIALAIAVNIIVVLLFSLLIVLVFVMQQRSQKRLQKIAYEDPVTLGFNRARFEDEAGRAIRANPPDVFVLVSMDIQKFKLINDAFGSEQGNDVLKHVHDTIRRRIVDGEMIARLSADTFNLLLKNQPREQLLPRLEAMASAVNAFNDALTRKYYLPLSMGIYTVNEPELSFITIQDRANVARKKNKDLFMSNRLCSCVFYSDTVRVNMMREKEMDNRMETALQNGEFVVYYQPKFELYHDRVAGAEALVRWQDPERGLTPPDAFIPLFERNGFIVSLDLYVFGQVCATLRSWLDAGLQPPPVSVNLSRIHLGNPDFLTPFVQVSRRLGIPPHLLEFELTETLVFENTEALTEVIRKIHEAGFSCSLDDFGSGYSSLNLLKSVPVDVLKLDKCFFGGGEGDARGENVVRSVLDLARKLNMKTVCEGVESLSQVDFLRSAGCGMVQGFVFSKPVPLADFERLAFDKVLTKTQL